jgi:RNA-directed DNA polymerase
MGQYKPKKRYRLLGKNLSLITGIATEHLETIPRAYRSIKIPKRNGGVRHLSVPHTDLLALQRKLLRRIFSKLPVHRAAKGFVSGRSTIHHAREHIRKPWVVVIDIEDFFASTTADRLISRFHEFGWGFAQACRVARVACHPETEALPQGAPTSPILSNIVNYVMDHRLAQFADLHSLSYTRYADDIAFSPQHPNFRLREEPPDPLYVIRAARAILHDYGYRLNESKIRVLRPNQRQMLTGVVVNGGCSVPREIRRRLRAACHRQEHGSPMSLVTERGERNAMSDAQLQGWLAYEAMLKKGKEERGHILNRAFKMRRKERQRLLKSFAERWQALRELVVKQAEITSDVGDIAVALQDRIKALRTWCIVTGGFEEYEAISSRTIVERALRTPTETNGVLFWE